MLTIEYIPMHYYDAIIIHFTDDDGNPHNIIVDGGEINSAKYCYTDRLKGKLEEIFNNGESIDLWVITHIDNDHIGGLYNFINDKEFFESHHQQLKEVWMNYGGKGDYDVQRDGTIGYSSGKKLRDVLREKKVNVREGIIAGQSATFANVEITVVAPDSDTYDRYMKWWNGKEFKEMVETTDGLVSGGEWDYETAFKDFDLKHYEEDKDVKNNSSIAFVLTYEKHRILFAADSSSSILMKGLNAVNLEKDGKVKLDLMHMPHHGSSRNTSYRFLEAIDSPKYVITGNGENRYKLPDKETIARLNAANPEGCELHFTVMNSKLQEIFEGENGHHLTVCEGATFTFEANE